MPMIGGNTVRAEGGINAAETPLQKKLGIPDTIDQFFDFLLALKDEDS